MTLKRTLSRETVELLERSKKLAKDRKANWEESDCPADPYLELTHQEEIGKIQAALSARQVAESETLPAGLTEYPHRVGQVRPAGNLFDRAAAWWRKFNI